MMDSKQIPHERIRAGAGAETWIAEKTSTWVGMNLLPTTI